MTVKDITLRHLAPGEAEAWLDFLHREVFPCDPRENLAGIWDAEGDPAGVQLAVDAAKRMAGSVRIACMDTELRGCPVRMGIVSGVGVRSDMRGRGLARRLFSAAWDYMARMDVPVAHLYSREDTLDFYRNLGFGALPRRPGEDFWRMYWVRVPFPMGERRVSCTAELLALLQEGE